MKVIHLVTSLNVGGAERFVLDLSRAQTSVGKNVSIFAMGTANDELIAKGACDGLDVRIINKHSPISLISFVLLLLRCDVIHIHSPYAYKALFPILRRLASGNVVYTRHGAGRFDSEEWRQFHFNAQKHLRALAFVSSEAKAVFEEVNSKVTVNGQVIDNGVIVPSKAELDIDPTRSTLSIGSVGRMVKLKYQRHLIEAVAMLEDNIRNKLSVHFFGDGEDREMLEAGANGMAL
jgi:glycosyltransferase involved in cell wall biosynthesis